MQGRRGAMDGDGHFSMRSKTIGRQPSAVPWSDRFLALVAFIAICCVFLVLCSAAKGDVKAGTWAKYKMLSTYTYRGEKPPLEAVTLRVGPTEKFRGKPYRWWQMECEKMGGGAFATRVLSEGVPMTWSHQSSGMGLVVRYLLREGEESPVEYVNAETGEALLPQCGSMPYVFPASLESSGPVRPFAAQGVLLGQMLALWEWSAEGEFPPLAEPEVLTLDPGLLIGTGRDFRDTLDRRITGDEDYPYRRFTKEEYDEMIESGINYFTVDPEQAEWIRRRAVFYEQGDLRGVRFPEILYRSNYMGAVQFVDEPACYIYSDDDAKRGAKRPSDLAGLLRFRVWRTLKVGKDSYSSLGLERALQGAGFQLGSMEIVEPDIPIWETLIHTSFYQLESRAASGIIHEGRYRLDSFRNGLKKVGVETEWIDARQMLLFQYALLRGAARAWGTDWGMSIYGQADPAISPLAVTLAYDLGARYIWYWTSDHGHHMPYREQLELTRHLRAHQKEHPRESRKRLRDAATVAVALPYGYVIDAGPLWGSSDFAHDRLNEKGVPHGDAVRAAVKEAFACLKKGEAFDFVVDHAVIRTKGYKRIVRIREDGSVERAEK